jgi:hypothetical protein
MYHDEALSGALIHPPALDHLITNDELGLINEVPLLFEKITTM